jgi:hypothetical protein
VSIPVGTGSTRPDCPPMTNHLLIGIADKTERLLQIAQRPFLWIDDNPPDFARATYFDPNIHSFDPLYNIDHKTARDFARLLYAIEPGGEGTLTTRNGRRSLARAFISTARLHKLKGADAEAEAMIDDLLFTPLMRRVLCSKPNFTVDASKTIIARLDRAELGDTDALILANLLIGHYKGQIVVPDAGFYLRDIHTSLIRQNRLIAGVNFLAELPDKLQQAMLTVKDKTAYRTNLKDAEQLLPYFPRKTKPSHFTELEGDEFLSTC